MALNIQILPISLLSLLAVFSAASSTCASEPSIKPSIKQSDPRSGSWTVPFGGNAFATSREIESRRRGGMRWDDSETVLSFYFRIDRPATIQIELRAGVPEGKSQIRVTATEKSFAIGLNSDEPATTTDSTIALGTVQIEQAGYVRIDLQGVSRTGPVFAEISELLITSETPDLQLNCVRDNESNRFYWGRRGPSVHLSFRMPQDREIEWFYSEITVPLGKDPIGSYFMANGFGEGYFGMQVNSSSERRILFSVWSPFRTDNPRDIPDDQRVVMLAKGENVRTGEFGNEGSGGQSFLVFPWKAGLTYRFLNRAFPDGAGNTIYTAWFRSPEAPTWQLIASFRRPKTDKYLTGLHSFLENFSDRHGWLDREGHYGNQWACDNQGNWHSLTEARFTGDDIARRSYRLDYAGGLKEREPQPEQQQQGQQQQQFFLRNGGFFAETVKLDSRFTRSSNDQSEPAIEFEKLEGFVRR